MSIKSKLGEKKNKFLKSKTIVFILGLIIGVTFTYSYIVGKPMYEYMKTGYKYSTEFLNRAEASATRPNMVSSVSTDGHLDEVTTTGQVTAPEALIKKYFPENYETALAIAKCESSLRPDNIGDGHLSKPSIGLFQISQIYHDYTTEQLQDAEFNVKIAREIYDKKLTDGTITEWKAWTCWKNLGYQKFLIN